MHTRMKNGQKKLENKQNVYERHFSGLKVNCINDYIKPGIRKRNLSHIIFHSGRNDLSLDKNLNSFVQLLDYQRVW